MELSSDNVDELKIKIRSVLQSSQQGVKKSNFLGEYTELTGEGINVKRLGFKTIGDFMASIPDTVAGRGDTYTAVTTESTEHLEKLIHRQRPPTTYNRSRDTGHPRNNHGARQPVRKYGRNSASSQHQNHKIASGRRFNRHVSSSSGMPTHRNGHYSYNANNKFKPPPKMPMAVPRLPGRATPPVNTNSTTTPVNGLRTKVLSILCQAADGLHISALQKRFRSQTGTNIPFAEYGYNSIGDLMLGFMWNNFKCIHSGDFYFAVRSSSRPSNNSGGAVHNNNNNNNDNNHHHHHNHRQPARNGNNGPTWGRNGGNPTGPFNNNRHRPVPFRDSSDNKRNTMSRPSETNGSMQNRRFISQHSNNPKGPQNRYIHRNKEQTANGRGQRAMLSMCDDNNKEAFINNQQNFNGSSYGETDSLTTTTSSSHYYHHHQGPFQHRLSRSDTTRSEFASDASSSSDYSPSASGSFQKNLKSEANNNMRNRSYSTTSNNSGGGGSNSSQPLEDYDYDSPCDEHLSFHSGEESRIFKNTFDPISSGLRFKKGRGCGRGYGLSSYMGERLPGEPRPSERSVALSENWSSTEKLSFQHGNTPIENLIISIRNTSLSDNDDNIDKQPTTALDVGCGLGRGRGRTRKTSDPSTRF